MPTSIITKHSTTSGDTPAASGLAVGELAVNVADGKLFTKNGSNEVIAVIGQGAEFLPEQYGAVGDGTTDDTTALQACFTAAIAAKGKVKLAAKTYKYAGLLATVTEGIDVEGSGDRTILLKADSYTGAAFELNNTFGQIGHFYPNGAGDQSQVADTTKMKSPSFSKFSIVGFSRNYAGFGFDFKDRNDMVSIQDVNCFNLKGSAFRFTGTFGNLRESNIRRLVVRMCGDENHPAVDLKMPSFSNTGVEGSLDDTTNKTRWEIKGTGDNFSGMADSRKRIRVQGSRLDGGTQEWEIGSIISDTVVELTVNIESTNPETGENYGQIPRDSQPDPQPISAPATFYRDVDGLNHIAFNDCQIVGCYGTYLRVSHDRVNFFRRVVFNNLMIHGSNKKYQDDAQQGPSGDLILIEGGIGSVYFRGLRLNTNEVDKGVTPNILYAGMRVRSGQVITQDIPDRIWINDLDMLNLNNDGEAMFVVEKVKNMSVNGTVAASQNSGIELKVLADSVTDGIDYNVVSGTSANIRNKGEETAFVIDPSVEDRVFINTNHRKAVGEINVKDFGAIGDGNADDKAAIQSAIDYAEARSISPQGSPIVVFPTGRYRIGSSGDSTGIVIKEANVQGSGPFGCTLVWGGDANGTCVQWEAKFRKFFSGFRFSSFEKTVNDPKYWIDATYVSEASIIPKLDYGDFFSNLFFEQTSTVTDACHMNLPKIINFYCSKMRFQAAPHLIRIEQFTTASANRVFAMQDWTTDFNQFADGGVKSLFKVDMPGNASLTLALSNARIETRNNAMGTPKAIVEVHNSFADDFVAGSQSFTSTEGQVDYIINTAPDLVDYGDQLTITDDTVQIPRRDFSYDADTKTVTLSTAPATGSAIVINWSPFTMPINGISLDMRDMGVQLTKTAVDGSQVSQEAVLVHHNTTQTNVTSDIQMQNVYLDGFSSMYGGNWSTLFSTPDPSDLTTNVRLKFWSTGRMPEKMSQQLGDYVKFGDAVQFHREAANSLSMAGVGTDVAMTLDVHGDLNVNDNTGVAKAGFTGSTGSLRVGNSASGSSLGSVVKKIEVFDAAGSSLGFVPVYNSIS